LVDVARRTGIVEEFDLSPMAFQDELFSDVVKSMTRPLPISRNKARVKISSRLMDVSFDRVTDQRERRMAETIVAEAQTFLISMSSTR